MGKLTTVALHGENAGVCDHIKNLASGGKDTDDNLQTLCQGCDAIKSRIEAGIHQPKRYSTKVGTDGWPTDPKHPANGGRVGGV
jgi:5-methylcytosine-specific restriction endonuclease McrA|tara:strand:- start:22 stop:273 length:252 start_codon:yes stop_codon:yes gene_type:complete